MTHLREPTAVRKQQIIKAAGELIIEHGSEHITVRRMAQAVGISEGAIYRHFKSKRDVLLLLADQVQRDLVGDVAEASSNVHSPLEVLDSVFRRQLSAGDGGEYRIVSDYRRGCLSG